MSWLPSAVSRYSTPRARSWGSDFSLTWPITTRCCFLRCSMLFRKRTVRSSFATANHSCVRPPGSRAPIRCRSAGPTRQSNSTPVRSSSVWVGCDHSKVTTLRHGPGGERSSETSGCGEPPIRFSAMRGNVTRVAYITSTSRNSRASHRGFSRSSWLPSGHPSMTSVPANSNGRSSRRGRAKTSGWVVTRSVPPTPGRPTSSVSSPRRRTTSQSEWRS